MMRLNTIDAQTGTTTRIEITREPDTSIRFRRWVNEALQDDRLATASEVEQVLASEQEERQRTVETAVAAALTQLQAARDAGTALVPGLTTVAGATFSTNVQRDNAIRGLATTTRSILIDCLDEMVRVEKLLVRAAAQQYDDIDNDVPAQSQMLAATFIEEPLQAKWTTRVADAIKKPFIAVSNWTRA